MKPINIYNNIFITGKTGIGRFGLMDGQSLFSFNGIGIPLGVFSDTSYFLLFFYYSFIVCIRQATRYCMTNKKR